MLQHAVSGLLGSQSIGLDANFLVWSVSVANSVQTGVLCAYLVSISPILPRTTCKHVLIRRQQIAHLTRALARSFPAHGSARRRLLCKGSDIGSAAEWLAPLTGIRLWLARFDQSGRG